MPELHSKRQTFQLTFDKLPGPLLVQTLLRGEIYHCYNNLGYPTREIPGDRLVDQCAVETTIFRVSCINRPEGLSLKEIPAGVFTVVARFVLEKSGFLENSQNQLLTYQNAKAYANSPEGRAEALIMSTFPKYNREDLMAMSYSEWTDLVFLAVAAQTVLYNVDAARFISPQTEESNQTNESLPPELIAQAYEKMNLRPGAIQPGGAEVVGIQGGAQKTFAAKGDVPANLIAEAIRMGQK